MWQNVRVSIERREIYLKSILNNQLLINKEDALPARVGMDQVKVQSAKQAPLQKKKKENPRKEELLFTVGVSLLLL